MLHENRGRTHITELKVEGKLSLTCKAERGLPSSSSTLLVATMVPQLKMDKFQSSYFTHDPLLNQCLKTNLKMCQYVDISYSFPFTLSRVTC